MKINITKRSNLTPFDFYQNAENFLESYAKEAGVKNLEKYFIQTDYLDDWVYKKLYGLNLDNQKNKLSYLFAQFAYHVTNGQNSPFLNFNEKVKERKEIHCDFDIDKFVEKYQNMNSEDRIKYFSPIMKSNSERVIVNTNRYIKLLLNVANYLKTKGSRENVISEIIEKTPINNPRQGIDFVLNTIMKGGKQEEKLNVAYPLVCDLMKELDYYFNFMCKPDTHIKDILGSYLGRDFNKETSNNFENNYNCIIAFIDVLSDIKISDKNVNGYKFDRMLYLIGSGNFFLDGIKFKNRRLKKKEFLSKFDI